MGEVSAEGCREFRTSVVGSSMLNYAHHPNFKFFTWMVVGIAPISTSHKLIGIGTMQRPYKTLIALFVLLAFSFPLMAAEVEIQGEGTPQRKLQRGFLNVVLCPFEISNELSKEVRNDTLPPSWIAGLGRGSFYAVGRALVGVYEMLTFPVPCPANYKPVLSPEFPWQLAPSADKK